LIAPAALVLALILSLAALVVGSLALYGVRRIQQGTLVAVTEARSALSQVSDYTVETSIPISQTFPVAADIPLEQDFVVPIRTTVPISATVQVPVRVPILGTYQMAVPVAADVPIDLRVVIPVSQTVVVSTAVTLDTEVPVRLELRQLGLDDLVEQIDGALGQMERELQGWPGNGD
jgi:hypothetical protein